HYDTGQSLSRRDGGAVVLPRQIARHRQTRMVARNRRGVRSRDAVKIHHALFLSQYPDMGAGCAGAAALAAHAMAVDQRAYRIRAVLADAPVEFPARLGIDALPV